MDLDKKISSFIKKYGKRIKYNFLIDKILFGILLCGVISFILLSICHRTSSEKRQIKYSGIRAK